jgi:hypothetical protein
MLTAAAMAAGLSLLFILVFTTDFDFVSRSSRDLPLSAISDEITYTPDPTRSLLRRLPRSSTALRLFVSCDRPGVSASMPVVTAPATFLLSVTVPTDDVVIVLVDVGFSLVLAVALPLSPLVLFLPEPAEGSPKERVPVDLAFLWPLFRKDELRLPRSDEPTPPPPPAAANDDDADDANVGLSTVPAFELLAAETPCIERVEKSGSAWSFDCDSD